MVTPEARVVRPGLALALAVLASCAAPPARDEGSAPELGVNFHHVHVRVSDPAAGMNRLARAHGCDKTIVQGAGAGVRCGRAFVLFERDTTPPVGMSLAGEVHVAGRGDGATVHVRLAAHDGAAARRALEALAPDAVRAVSFVEAGALTQPASIAHVAFVVAESADLTGRITAAGARTMLATADRVVASAPGGVTIELMHDAALLRPGEEVDRGQTFWCSMHPDVRARRPGTCPLCAMALVPVPPLRVGEYTFEVTADADRRLTLRVRDPDTGEPVTAFHTVHERLLHLFVISRDLSYFAHEHPTLEAGSGARREGGPGLQTGPTSQSDGRFTIDLRVPQPDVYLLAADVTPAGGTPQMLRHFWVTHDFRGRPFVPRDTLVVDTTPQTRGTLRASLVSSSFDAGQRSDVTITLADAHTRQPVTDLEPYLGAAGHLVAASADLAHVVHGHPADATTTGPDITFPLTFPRAGRYKLWAQFQRKGQVQTVAFVVEVR